MEVGEELSTMATISKSTAVTACVAMTLLYVAILYAPTLIFRLPPPTSYQQFMIRRFVCAAASSLLCVFISFFLLLPVKSWKITYVLNLYGIQADNVWHAVIFPLSLTSLVYAGSLVLKCLLLLDSWIEDGSEGITLNCLHNLLHKIYCGFISVASNIGAWRNLVVAPITEELVFRACMIPLLLCGGFKVQAVLLLCPMFFSLAHLNHLLEFYFRKNHSLLKTSLAVGTQLAYTMIFGSYASFLFIRSGHLSAPLVAHIVCNYMGLPAVYARRKGVVVSLAFISGTMAFVRLLFPLTSPALYNNRTDNCRCWHGYCSWS
ncbi:CAAX prenyl protease 2-like [Chenopodium quinoa]|uniref:CAAX prenyl protease 2-like n=1 Tax=Chenopodium quinoa TaxID=63459 RepID=UPI000B774784|nr:CAAX prenyl protease 2-like [Chenopodium quinoa]XP_021764744.1 CAAX prenyl protease 2-like [Chenopodium quinoa]